MSMNSVVLAKMSAKSYYGPHATGSVLLVNWQPFHFTGSSAEQDRNAMMLRMIEQRKSRTFDLWAERVDLQLNS